MRLKPGSLPRVREWAAELTRPAKALTMLGRIVKTIYILQAGAASSARRLITPLPAVDLLVFHVKRSGGVEAHPRR